MADAPHLFVVVLTYVAPIEAIDAAGVDHVAWLQEGYAAGAFLASGRRVPRNGGIIIATAASQAELEERLRGDPFQARNLAVADILPFEGNLLNDALRTALDAGAAGKD